MHSSIWYRSRYSSWLLSVWANSRPAQFRGDTSTSEMRVWPKVDWKSLLYWVSKQCQYSHLLCNWLALPLFKSAVRLSVSLAAVLSQVLDHNFTTRVPGISTSASTRIPNRVGSPTLNVPNFEAMKPAKLNFWPAALQLLDQFYSTLHCTIAAVNWFAFKLMLLTIALIVGQVGVIENCEVCYLEAT